MAISYSAIFRAVAPYLAQIATAAIPAFISQSEAFKSDSVMSKQIDELQIAVSQNAGSVHILAEKLQQAIEGIEESAKEAKIMLFVSLTLSAVSLVICIYFLVR